MLGSDDGGLQGPEAMVWVDSRVLTPSELRAAAGGGLAPSEVAACPRRCALAEWVCPPCAPLELNEGLADCVCERCQRVAGLR